MKVLIADDEPLFITVLENALKHLGHTVSSASNGKEALNLWKNGEIPL
jgi:CheY-like chemotaxis protein